MRKDGKKSKKEKKEKIVYVDDGSTVADMTPTDENGKRQKTHRERSYAPNAPLRDQLRTFTDAQKMMFLPMCVMLGILALAFLILYFLL